MPTLPGLAYPFQALGVRTGPRIRWLAFSRKYLEPLVIGLSAIPFGLAAYQSHPLAAPALAFGFVVFGLVGYGLENWPFQRGAAWVPRFLVLWSIAGLIGNLITFFWLVRGSTLAIAASMWPLLIYGMYFVLRIFRRVQFMPYILAPIIFLTAYALITLSFFADESDPLLNTASAIWLVVAFIAFVVQVRTWDYHVIRFEAFRDLVRWAGSIDAKAEEIQTKLNAMGKRLNLERLTVLRIFRPPARTDLAANHTSLPPGADAGAYHLDWHVEIVANYVPGLKPSDRIKPWSLHHGLLGKAFRERRSVICPDTESVEFKGLFFNPPNATGYLDTRSEIVQPIYESPDGQIIGFVDLQSDRPRSFEEQDLDYLTALAAAIAPLMVKERLGSLIAKVEQLRNELEELDDEHAVFDHLARFAIDHLDVDVVTYYQLGFGNGWPRLPAWHLGSWFPQSLDGQMLHRDNAPQLALVAYWEPLFARDSRNDLRLFPTEAERTSSHFITREQIRSTAFLPMGTRQRRIGALFFSYRAPQQFSPATQLALEILRETVTPHLERTRQLQDTQAGFGQVNLVLHDLVRDSIATNAAIASPLTRLREAIDANNGELTRKYYADLFDPIQAHTNYVSNASLKFNLVGGELLRSGLGLAFAAASGVIAQCYKGCSLRVDIPESVERLPLDLRLAIFSLVTEAAHNAMHSGCAKLVNASVSCKSNQIQVSILSDGDPWNPDAPSKPYSRYGIDARLQLAHNRMSIEHQWSMEGRHLHIAIPILPILDGRDPYVQ
jgi:putative methionine-R-sulfoxide reductase with GAF domain